MTDSQKSSHRDILKSSALIGGGSLVNIALGLVRTKCAAVFLGTLGVGTLSTYSSITSLGVALAGLGVASSGVRQIAVALAKNDPMQISKTSAGLRLLSLVLGVVGAFVIILFAARISIWTFENKSQEASLNWLSITILLGIVSNGQTALVQGFRRVGDLVRINTISGLLGTIISVLLMVVLGQNSVIPTLIIISVTSVITSWHYSKGLGVTELRTSLKDAMIEAVPLLRLGVAFALSGLMTASIAYVTRVILIKKLGVEATGLYSASWQISGVYVGFILTAMGTDFYPRLTAVANDENAVTRLVNEQTEVALLLALPGVVVTIAFSPWLLNMLYSASFVGAAEILRWQALGLVIKVVSWPMAFIILAKGKSKLFFVTEVISSVSHLTYIWLAVDKWGVVGTGIAFLMLYVTYLLIMVKVTKDAMRFSWSAQVRWLAFASIALGTSTFVMCNTLPAVWSIIAGSIIGAATVVWSLRKLTTLLGFSPLKLVAHRLKGVSEKPGSP